MNEKPSIADAAPEDCREKAWNEADRLAALQRYAILDTGREPAFDDIATLAADILEAPVAVVNFIAADRQWFKAEVGIGTDTLPLDVSICRHVILQPGVTVVPDLAQDPRFQSNPLVNAADGGLRFYAGALLETPDGLPIGTICVLDTKPRPDGISERQRRTLCVLAQQAMAQLELRRSERQAAAEAGRAERESRRVGDIFAHAPAGLSEIGLDGHFLSVNDEFCRLLGRPREELLALTVADVTHPDDIETSRALLKAAAETGKPFTAEKRYRRPGGAVVWASSRIARVGGGNGEPIRLLAVTVDIGEQRIAQAALRESREELQLLTDAMPALVTYMTAENGELRYRFVNERYGEWFGRDRDEIAGRLVQEVMGEAAYAGVKPWIERAIGGERVTFEQFMPYRGAPARHVRVEFMPRIGANGGVEGIYALVQDISQAKRSEAALRESEERFRNMADHAPVMMWVSDAAGRCTYLNQRWYEFTGQSEAEAMGFGWLDALHPDDRPTSERAFGDANARPESFRTDYRLRRTDGAYRWVIDAASPRFGLDGEFLGYVGSVIDIDERKEVENALRESETRYRTLFEAIEAGFCVVEVLFDEAQRPVDYRFVEVNPAFEKQTGLRDAAGRTAREMVPDLEPHWFEIYGQVALTGVPVRFENGSDAMGRWFDVHALRVGTRRVAILFNDISARKRSEEALRAYAEELRTVLDAVPAGIWITRDPDAKEITGNARSYEMLRVPAGGNQSKTNPETATGHFEFLDPQGRPLPPENLPVQQAARGKEVRDYEFRVAFSDGGHIDIFGNAMPLRDSAGQISGAVAAFVDITARKAVEARLRELNETLERRIAEALAERKLLADIVEGTDSFVQVIDNDYRWLAVNRAAANEFERVFGVRPRVGDCMLELLADQPESREDVRRVWGRALAGEEFTEVAAFGDPARDRRFYEMKFNVLRDKNGRRIGAYQFVHDVTERLNEQARLREAEGALRQAQKMEAVGQLTGGIAHDFNNMLAVVIGGLSMLERKLKRGDTDVARYVEGAMEGAHRAASLTQRLLAFARQQPLAPEPVDLNGMIEGMTELLARSLGETVAVETSLASSLWLTKADRSQLENALLNLALNARDAMPEGGTLTLATANMSPTEAAGHVLPPGSYVMASVSDTGTGMSEEVKARAFDPFFTTKGVGKGTGLGLSQVFGFIRQSGGHVTIDTALGHGTTVRLFLPRFDGAYAAPDAKPDGVGHSDGQPNEVVMVVEDEERVRSLSVDALRELGYTIVEAPSATDALRMIESGQPVSLLFTDVVMPDMNGTALAAEARRLSPKIKVLFATGYARDHGGEGSLAAVTRALGADILFKPFDIGQLAQKVRAALDGRREETD